MEVSVDGGWQKRGSGQAYDSLSGFLFIIIYKYFVFKRWIMAMIIIKIKHNIIIQNS